jgi:hypothetical protein
MLEEEEEEEEEEIATSFRVICISVVSLMTLFLYKFLILTFPFAEETCCVVRCDKFYSK